MYKVSLLCLLCLLSLRLLSSGCLVLGLGSRFFLDLFCRRRSGISTPGVGCLSLLELFLELFGI